MLFKVASTRVFKVSPSLFVFKYKIIFASLRIILGKTSSEMQAHRITQPNLIYNILTSEHPVFTGILLSERSLSTSPILMQQFLLIMSSALPTLNSWTSDQILDKGCPFAIQHHFKYVKTTNAVALQSFQGIEYQALSGHEICFLSMILSQALSMAQNEPGVSLIKTERRGLWSSML